MTTKKALTISLLAIALTGLTAGIITYSKKTGKNPFKAQETKAYTINESYTKTTNGFTYTYTGFYDAEYTYAVDISYDYEITYTKNNTTYSLSATFIPGYQYAVEGNNYTASGTEIIEYDNTPLTITNTSAKEIKYIEIKSYTETEYAEITINFIYTDNTTTINTISYTYETHPTLQDINWDYYTRYIEQINIKNIVDSYATYGNNQFQAGAQTNIDYGNDIVDVRGLMLNIITMPFTFISQAFDVTFWEGTQYEFHLAGFIKGLIAIGAILFIIRLFTSGFSIVGNFTNRTNNNIKQNTRQPRNKNTNTKKE